MAGVRLPKFGNSTFMGKTIQNWIIRQSRIDEVNLVCTNNLAKKIGNRGIVWKSRVGRLVIGQCAYCKMFGHWKRECHKLFEKSIRLLEAKVSKGALVVKKGVRDRSSYYPKGSTDTGVPTTSVETDSTRLWHLRLGHSSIDSLQALAMQGLVKGASTCELKSCEHYDVSMKTEVKFDTFIHRVEGLQDVVHVGVWGPSKEASLEGNRDLVSFVDDCSRHVWVATMSRLREVLVVFNEWKKCIEIEKGRKIEVLRYDYGGKYKRDSFLHLCRAQGILRHFNRKGTLGQLDGVAKLMNRVLLEKTRCLLSSSGLQKRFWCEALTYSCHLINRLPSAAIGGKTPLEIWSGRAATDYGLLRIFGCPAYCHIKNVKVDPSAMKLVFLGFRGEFGYKLWDSVAKKIVLSRNVTCDEASMMEPIDSQQVESIGQIIDGSRRVECDATSRWVEITPRSPGHSVSFGIPAEVTQVVNHSVDVDTDDIVEDQGQSVQDQDLNDAGGHSSDLDMAIGTSLLEVIGECVSSAGRVD